MPPISYARHRFPPVIIPHAVWLHLRFTLSYRDVEDLLAERRLEVSYETVRRWVLKFGPAIARRLRQRRARPTEHWHLDEMAVRIAGERMHLWRAVDGEGEVLDVLLQHRRDEAAARKPMRKLLRKQGFAPTEIATDGLRSYGAAFAELGMSARHERGLRRNNRAEVSRRAGAATRAEDAGLQVAGSAQRFVSVHAAYNAFNVQRHLISPSYAARLPGGGDGAMARGDGARVMHVRTLGVLARRPTVP